MTQCTKGWIGGTKNWNEEAEVESDGSGIEKQFLVYGCSSFNDFALTTRSDLVHFLKCQAPRFRMPRWTLENHTLIEPEKSFVWQWKAGLWHVGKKKLGKDEGS